MSTFPVPTSHEAREAPAARVALVTGAAQGIGRGIVLRLARDGYRVAAADLPQQLSKLHELEQEVISCRSAASLPACEKVFVAITADVSVEDAVKAMVAKCVEVLGRLDVVSPSRFLDPVPNHDPPQTTLTPCA